MWAEEDEQISSDDEVEEEDEEEPTPEEKEKLKKLEQELREALKDHAKQLQHDEAKSPEERKKNTQRDLYGFEIKPEHIEEYGKFIDDYMSKLQEQNEGFEKFITLYQASLDEGVLPFMDNNSASSTPTGQTPNASPLLSHVPPSASSKELNHSGGLLGQRASLIHNYINGIAKSSGNDIVSTPALTNAQIKANFIALLKKGIPPKYRCRFWQIFSGTIEVIRMSTGLYQQVLDDHIGKSSEATTQIDKDISRTFASNIGSFSREALRRVLIAYSWKNPRIGYCQAMNFITAGLLVFMSEEEAFWMLAFIVERLLPNYFNENLTGSRIDAYVLYYYMRKRIPKLYKHFQKLGFDLLVVCTQWLMCLYITSVPNETAFRIWDIAFFMGPKVIFEVALAIFKINEKKLLTLQDDTEIGLLLNSEVSKLYNSSKIFEAHIKPIDNKKLHKMREHFKEQVEKETKTRQFSYQLEDLSQTTHFDMRELALLRSQFSELDALEDTINVATFDEVMRNIFPEWKGKDTYFLEHLFRVFDTNKDNFVDFKDLVRGLSILCKGSLEEKLTMCYGVFDVDGSGSITREKLQKMLSSIYRLFNQQDFEKEVHFFVDMIFQVADSDKR